MAPFKKLWTTFVDSIKPQALRQSNPMGPHSIYVDTRPFNAQQYSSRGR